MSSLTISQKKVFEKIFDRGGYVLDFTDSTFAEFFRENQIDINHHKYRTNGNSKMKRLRTFWEVESDIVVGKVLDELLEYSLTINDIKDEDQNRAKKTIKLLLGETAQKAKLELTEDDFLKKEFTAVSLCKLNLDSQLSIVIEQRIEEIHKSIDSGSALATIFLCGSTLEGLLLDVISKNIQSSNNAKSSPKDKEGKVRPISEWSLDSLINVAHELKLISLDVKKYGHTLRCFRNYIHPRQQASEKFNPDVHTAKICWQVLQAAIANLTGER